MHASTLEAAGASAQASSAVGVHGDSPSARERRVPAADRVTQRPLGDLARCCTGEAERNRDIENSSRKKRKSGIGRRFASADDEEEDHCNQGFRAPLHPASYGANGDAER